MTLWNRTSSGRKGSSRTSSRSVLRKLYRHSRDLSVIRSISTSRFGSPTLERLLSGNKTCRERRPGTDYIFVASGSLPLRDVSSLESLETPRFPWFPLDSPLEDLQSASTTLIFTSSPMFPSTPTSLSLGSVFPVCVFTPTRKSTSTTT